LFSLITPIKPIIAKTSENANIMIAVVNRIPMILLYLELMFFLIKKMYKNFLFID
jgi:hypothetical protein